MPVFACYGERKTFRDAGPNLPIKILTIGEYPGDGLPKAVAFPDPGHAGAVAAIDGVRVVALERLIELKLASGLSAPHRLRDLADVQDLILRLGLPAELADTLDSSVQHKYRELWQQAQAGRSAEPHD